MEKGTILIVDDDKTPLKLFKEQLKAIGHRVQTASRGKRAIQFVKEGHFDIMSRMTTPWEGNGSRPKARIFWTVSGLKYVQGGGAWYGAKFSSWSYLS